MAEKKQKVRIPNYNDLSCLIDRMIIEHVKCAIFEQQGEEENAKKIDLQKQISEALREELVRVLEEVFVDGYETIEETRTFKQ